MPLFYICLAFIAGVLAGPHAAWPAWAWLTGSAVCTAAAVTLMFQPGAGRGFGSRAAGVLAVLQLHPAAVSPVLIRQLPLLVLAAGGVGAARTLSAQPVLDAPGFIARYNDTGRRYTVTGTLAAPPDERDTFTYLRVAAEAIRPADGFRHASVRGLLLARIDPGKAWSYGDRVVVTGRLLTPPEYEDFSYREYLARQGVYAFAPYADAAVLETGGGAPVPRLLFAIRDRAHHTLRRLFPDPEAALLAGILLGIETGLAPDLADSFRDTGTAHIIAISGFNIAILAAIFTSMFSRLLGQRPGAFAAVGAVVGYTVLVGGDPAVVRAAVMGVLAIVFRRADRPAAALHTLVLAAAGMTFVNPGLPGDAGFQLSFAATAGLIFYAQPLTRGFGRLAARYLRISVVRRILPLVSDAVLLTLAAQIATLPVVLHHFGRLSLTALLANPLILPVQPAVMVLGGLAALSGMAWFPLGRLLAGAALPFVTYTIRLVELFARIPGGVVVVGGAGSGAALALAAGPALLGALRRAGLRGAQRFPAWRAALLALLLVLSSGTWRANLSRAPGLLRVHVLDVGMGEAILVHTPDDRRVLINGGPSAVRLLDQLGRRIPVSQRGLDWLVVAGTRAEQLAALPRALEQYRPAAVLWSGLQNNSYVVRNMQEMMLNEQVPVHDAVVGGRLDLGRGAALEVVAVTKRGSVLALSWGGFRMLLPIGIDFNLLEEVPGAANVLLLAESGFAPLNPAGWIAAVDPGLILLSVEAGNREGLPSPDVETLLERYNVLRTDRDGWVEIRTDGEEVWVARGQQ